MNQGVLEDSKRFFSSSGRPLNCSRYKVLEAIIVWSVGMSNTLVNLSCIHRKFDVEGSV